MPNRYFHRALLRAELSQVANVTERPMFSGLAFMIDDHMVCGLHGGGGMFRVGLEAQDQALAIPGVRPLCVSGHTVPGMVATTGAALADEATRRQLLALAVAFVHGLPPRDSEAWPTLAGEAR